VYSKAEKKAAHAEFIREKKENEERVRAASREARLAKAAEQRDQERQTWLILGGIASAAILLYFLFRG
jgi:DNA-binding MurR/RpiR family transcriptional regulator